MSSVKVIYFKALLVKKGTGLPDTVVTRFAGKKKVSLDENMLKHAVKQTGVTIHNSLVVGRQNVRNETGVYGMFYPKYM